MTVRKVAAFASVLLGALALGGCMGTYGGKASLGRTSLPEHVVTDLSHPWHSYPAQAVGLPVTIVLGVVTLPLDGIEWAITGDFPLKRTDPGYVLSGCAYVGLGAGSVVGLPFYLLALPFDERREESPDREEGGRREALPEPSEGSRP